MTPAHLAEIEARHAAATEFLEHHNASPGVLTKDRADLLAFAKEQAAEIERLRAIEADAKVILEPRGKYSLNMDGEERHWEAFDRLKEALWPGVVEELRP